MGIIYCTPFIFQAIRYTIAHKYKLPIKKHGNKILSYLVYTKVYFYVHLLFKYHWLHYIRDFFCINIKNLRNQFYNSKNLKIIFVLIIHVFLYICLFNNNNNNIIIIV